MSRSRTITMVLAVAFLAPLALAWGLYHQTTWHPLSGLQHGELLMPFRPLVPPPMRSADGRGSGVELFHGRWTLLYRSHGRCDGECRNLMDTLRRVRLAQGRAMERVQRVLVEPDEGSADFDNIIDPIDPDLRVMLVNRWPLPDGSVYVVDPQGNLVLRYQPGFDPRGLLKDLHRLLQLSGEG